MAGYASRHEVRAPSAWLNYLCPGYKLFFEHVDEPMRIMFGLVRQGRAPSGSRACTPHATPAEDATSRARAGRGAPPPDARVVHLSTGAGAPSFALVEQL
jgi:serine-type anaerobic sulfatase-maturating enzyme